MSSWLETLSHRLLVPFSAAIAALSLLSLVILVFAGPPDLKSVDSNLVFAVLLTGLAVFGVLFPAMLSVLMKRLTGVRAALVFFSATIANAAALDSAVVVFPQGIISATAALVGLIGAVASLVDAADRQNAKPAKSKL
jgi:hypothetical protein